MTKIKAILFDLDGTLINSEKAFCNSFIHILNDEYNANITEEDYEKYELKENAMLLKTLTKKGIITEDHDVIMSKVYMDYEKNFEKVIKEKDVLENIELIKKMKEKGYIVALVSTSKRFFVDKLLEETDSKDLFSYIVAREDVKNLKPSSDAYLLVLDKLNLKPEECIAVEDSLRGIKASICANIKTYKVDEYTTIKFQNNDSTEVHSVRDVLKTLK
ncbi:MAG: HAD family hydrolase [Bacilli bacterium]